jgi:hypothetical protein
LPLAKLDSVASRVVMAKQDDPQMEPVWIYQLFLRCRETRTATKMFAEAGDWLSRNLCRFPPEELAEIAGKLQNSGVVDNGSYRVNVRNSARALNGKQLKAVNLGWKNVIPTGKQSRSTGRGRTRSRGWLNGRDPVMMGIAGTVVVIGLTVGLIFWMRSGDKPDIDDPNRNGPSKYDPNIVTKNDAAQQEIEQWSRLYPNS